MNYPHRRGQAGGRGHGVRRVLAEASGPGASMRIIVTGWTLMKKDIPPTIAGAGGSSARRRAEPEQERAPKKAGESREKIEISAEQRARFRSISGSENPAFAVNLACQVEAAQWRGNSRSDKQQEE